MINNQWPHIRRIEEKNIRISNSIIQIKNILLFASYFKA